MIEREPLVIRPIERADAAAVAQLNGELGYPATVSEVAQRIAALQNAGRQSVLVACRNNDVVGWIDVAITFHLQTPPYALIGGLVVKEGLRGQQIGKRLCEQAEAWSRAQGVFLMRVTSRSTRDDAHRFYLRDGYTDVKTSRVFEKDLSQDR